MDADGRENTQQGIFYWELVRKLSKMRQAKRVIVKYGRARGKLLTRLVLLCDNRHLPMQDDTVCA
jgi:GTP-binding protein EngB required for normal cell division